MVGNRTSELQSTNELIDCLRYRPNAVIAAQMREAAQKLELLTTVALAARDLVRTSSGTGASADIACVDEAALTALEGSLADAGYDMTEQELEEAL